MLREVLPSEDGQAPDPRAFCELVRDALAHLHDPPHLQRHPLISLISPRPSRAEAAKMLRNALAEAVEAVRPTRAVSADARVWRRHRLLTLRFIDALEPRKAAAELGISQSELFPEQHLAVEAVASLLWAHWGLGANAPALAQMAPPRPEIAGPRAEPSGAEAAAIPGLSPAELPLPWTSFVGREDAVVEVRRLLSTARLLTLIGAGGCGKTRLALEAARSLLSDCTSAVAFVDLAPISDPAVIAGTITVALGIKDPGNDPLPDTLRRRLRAHRLLLILDNCEHLIEPCAYRCDELLRACNGLTILATSREPLRLAGEVVWRVPSLDVPPEAGSADPDQLRTFGSVALFVDRAQAADPRFELTREYAPAIAEIARRLDGIPLALELAAPLVRVLSPDELSRRLSERFSLLAIGDRTAPSRHQTLRATLDWSYQLLDEAERLLLARLGVFVGPFSLASAEAVCADAGLEPGQVLGVLARLVDKSMLATPPASEREQMALYRLLETIRAYSWTLLVQSGDAPRLQRKLSDHYLAVVTTPDGRETTAERWNTPGPWYWRKAPRIRAEYVSIRAALVWLTGAGEATLALKLAVGLLLFWIYNGLVDEGLAHLKRLLALPAPLEPTTEWARATYSVGWLNYHSGQRADARRHLADSLTAFRALGDTYGIGLSLLRLGRLAGIAGDYATASAYIDEAEPILEGLSDQSMVSWATFDRGILGLFQSDLALAHRCYVEARDVWMALVHTPLLEADLWLGYVEFYRHDYAAAAAYWQRLADTQRERRAPIGVFNGLCLLSLIDVAAGDLSAAESKCSESLEMVVRSGDSRGLRLVLIGAARMAAARGDALRAIRLVGAASRAREVEQLAVPLWAQWVESWLAPARASLGEEASAAAWAEGQTMTLDQAIDHARAGLVG
jgi:non-specific serine/threonine protein kinase